MSKFTHVQCFQIDPEEKSVFLVYYPENIDPNRLAYLRDVLPQFQEELNRWAKEPDNSIYIVCLPGDVRIEIGKTSKSSN